MNAVARPLPIGIHTNGIKHTHVDPMPDVDTRFRMVRDAGVFDYVDKTPDPDQIDDFARASEKRTSGRCAATSRPKLRGSKLKRSYSLRSNF